MKKILVCFLFTVLVIGFMGCSISPTKSRQAVVSKYGPEVQSLPEFSYIFIARKTNGEVWYVSCLNSNDNNISEETLLFGPIKNQQ